MIQNYDTDISTAMDMSSLSGTVVQVQCLLLRLRYLLDGNGKNSCTFTIMQIIKKVSHNRATEDLSMP